MIMDDAAAGLGETATFCKPNDDKRPSLVGLPDGSTRQVCPIDGSGVTDGVSDAYPQGWFVRVEFDELLDPSIEDLTEVLDDSGQPTGTYSGSIAASHPVELKCTGVGGAMVDIPYDGYYSPAGNNVTWPLGPSIVVKPNVPASVPTNSHCTVSLNDNIHDKEVGKSVPTDQRGPFAFEVAPITVAAISPADKDHLDPIDAGMDIVFNTLIDPDTFDIQGPPATQTWAFTPQTDDTGSEGFVANGGVTAPNSIGFVPVVGGKKLGAPEWFVFGDFYAKTDYTWTLPQGTKLKDMCGVETTFGAPSVADNTQVKFSLNDITFTGITPTDGTMTALPSNKIQLKFNQDMDPNSLTGRCLVDNTFPCAKDADCVGTGLPGGNCDGNNKFTLSPAVTSLAVIEDPTDSSKLDIYGDFALDTSYTFTLNGSTTINECPGAETSGCGAVQPNLPLRSYVNANQQVVHFKTAAAIVLTSMTPADNATITKVEATTTPTIPGSGLQTRTSITLNFNQEMDPASLTQGTDFTIDPNIVLTASASTANFHNLRLRPPSTSGYPPGTYTFTLLAGASMDDYLGNHYVQPADKVIHFTIKDPDPAPDCIP